MARGEAGGIVTGLSPRGESGGLRTPGRQASLSPLPLPQKQEAVRCTLGAGLGSGADQAKPGELWVRRLQDLAEKIPVSQQHQQPRENQDDAGRAKILDVPFLLLLCTAQGKKDRGGEGGESQHRPSSCQISEMRTSSLLGAGEDMKQKWIKVDWTRLAFFK